MIGSPEEMYRRSGPAHAAVPVMCVAAVLGILNGVLISLTGAGASMMLFDRIAPAAVLLCAIFLLARISGTGSLGALFTVLLLIGGIIRIASVDLSPGGANNDLIARAVSLVLSIGTIGFALNAASRLKAAGFGVEVGSD